jgi:hypothetical protein
METTAGDTGRVFSAPDLLLAVGSTVFDVLHRPATAVEVSDIFLAEPGLAASGSRGELVLGVGFAAGAESAELVGRAAAAGASGLVLRRPAAENPTTRSAAEEHGLLLAALEPALPWAHVVWMLRGVLDRAVAPGSPVAGDAGVHNDLFVLADAAAGIVDAPVTIEDNRSRVLAYSSGQSLTDPARVSTIVGRRVPPEVVAHFRPVASSGGWPAPANRSWCRRVRTAPCRGWWSRCGPATSGWARSGRWCPVRYPSR